MNSRVTVKGQVTIPKEIRDLLGIKPGSAIEFEPLADCRAVMVVADKPTRKTNPGRFAALRGTATVKMTTQEILALTRDLGRYRMA